MLLVDIKDFSRALPNPLPSTILAVQEQVLELFLVVEGTSYAQKVVVGGAVDATPPRRVYSVLFPLRSLTVLLGP